MNRCFVYSALSPGPACMERRSGRQGLLKPKAGLGWDSLPQSVTVGQARIAGFSVFDHRLKRSHNWLFTLLSDVLFIFVLKKKKDKAER